jgi:hypothetical protein
MGEVQELTNPECYMPLSGPHRAEHFVVAFENRIFAFKMEEITGD